VRIALVGGVLAAVLCVQSWRNLTSMLAATLDEHGDDTERGDEMRTRQNTGSTLSS
jgi:hypothetical protein